jgi:hypothetical protein
LVFSGLIEGLNPPAHPLLKLGRGLYKFSHYVLELFTVFKIFYKEAQNNLPGQIIYPIWFHSQNKYIPKKNLPQGPFIAF